MKFIENEIDFQQQYLKKLHKNKGPIPSLLKDAQSHFNDDKFNIEQLENIRMQLDEEIVRVKGNDFITISITIIFTTVGVVFTILGSLITSNNGLTLSAIFSLLELLGITLGGLLFIWLLILFVLTYKKNREIALYTRLQSVVNNRLSKDRNGLHTNEMRYFTQFPARDNFYIK